MVRRPIFILVFAACVAVAAGYCLGLDDFRRIAPVMVALFGVLTGFLVNAMIRTATALEGTLTLNPSELQQIAAALTKQQAGWKRLFHLYLTVIVLVVTGALAPLHWPLTVRGYHFDLSTVAIAAFFGVVAVALARTLAVVDGIGALQELRSKLLISAAEKRERDERRKASGEIGFKPGPIDPNFGRKVAFPGGTS